MATEARDRMQRLSFMVPLDAGDESKPIPGASKRVTPITTARDAIREAEAEAAVKASEGAYVLLVSAIPALYRAWNQSPNETVERLNALLYAKVTDWVTAYQRETDRTVDSYPLVSDTDGG